MPRLIKLHENQRQIMDDPWLLLRECDCESLQKLDGRDLIVPLSCWLALHAEAEAVDTALAGAETASCGLALDAHRGRLAVWLDSHELPAQLGNTLHLPELIALHFPVFKDGRPFSSARELRLNLGYKGEIRAVGDVLRDQLFYMSRCGIDAFVMREDQDMDEALRAFDDFHEGYQSSVDRPVPLFRRRQFNQGSA